MATIRNSRAPCVRTDGKVTRHELAIRMLVTSNQNIHRNDFAAAMREFLSKYPRSDVTVPRVVPDAYEFDHDAGYVVLYEVDDSHPIPPNKLRQLADFWFDMDCDETHDYLPKLVIVDRYGCKGKEVDLKRLWHAFLCESVRAA